MLWEAQHEQEPQQVVLGMKALTCNYGECLKSNVTWGKRWDWTESKVRRFLKLLKNLDQIDYESEGITTRIKIINYSAYDPRRRESDEDATRTRRGRDEDATTDKNDKNVKNGKNTKTLLSSKDDTPTPQKPQNGICPHKKIIDLYHDSLPMLPRINVWDGNRRTWLGARWKEVPERQSLGWWKNFFAYVKTSDFLTGNTKTGFVADLEWMVKKDNFGKILNGRYENRKKNRTAGIDEWLRIKEEQMKEDHNGKQ
jgi:hypothetical protein